MHSIFMVCSANSFFAFEKDIVNKARRFYYIIPVHFRPRALLLYISGHLPDLLYQPDRESPSIYSSITFFLILHPIYYIRIRSPNDPQKFPFLKVLRGTCRKPVSFLDVIAVERRNSLRILVLLVKTHTCSRPFEYLFTRHVLELPATPNDSQKFHFLTCNRFVANASSP
jgi:hypothetical protein